MALMYASVCSYVHQDLKKSLKASSLLHSYVYVQINLCLVLCMEYALLMSVKMMK